MDFQEEAPQGNDKKLQIYTNYLTKVENSNQKHKKKTFFKKV